LPQAIEAMLWQTTVFVGIALLRDDNIAYKRERAVAERDQLRRESEVNHGEYLLVLAQVSTKRTARLTPT